MREARSGGDQALHPRERCVSAQETVRGGENDRYLRLAGSPQRSGGSSVELMKSSGAAWRRLESSVSRAKRPVNIVTDIECQLASAVAESARAEEIRWVGRRDQTAQGEFSTDLPFAFRNPSGIRALHSEQLTRRYQSSRRSPIRGRKLFTDAPMGRVLPLLAELAGSLAKISRWHTKLEQGSVRNETTRDPRTSEGLGREYRRTRAQAAT